MKHLLVEITRILRVIPLSKTYLQHLARISRVTLTCNPAKKRGIGFIFGNYNSALINFLVKDSWDWLLV